MPSSGHSYFTLKDKRSQIASVIFRTQAHALSFALKEGLAVVGFGRIGVYEPRGVYQIIFEYMEPQGIGSLHIAFEALKRRLADEGLFAQERKRPLPIFPKKISIVTSSSGAAVRDFIKIAKRRLPSLPLQVVPVRVQGHQAPQEIVQAIQELNQRLECDVIVVGRGGGSIEDLWAFNDENVARAIAASHIPVVSAVGHETDFTIADFVADLRAPTPSAAAEMIIPSQTELAFKITKLKEKIYILINNQLKFNRKTVINYSDRIVHPQRRLQDWRMRLDELAMRSSAGIREIAGRKRERLAFCQKMLRHASPAHRLFNLQTGLAANHQSLITGIRHQLHYRRADLASGASTLEALNPMAILKRGYSITRSLPDRAIVDTIHKVKLGQGLEVVLGNGRLRVTVDQKESDNAGRENQTARQQ